MHESARLNVFLGVRNVNEQFVPEHLEFLKGFLRKADMNLLFPVSVTVSTVVCVLLGVEAVVAGSAFEQACATFLFMMMALAILEHWFLILPLPSETLWNWSLGSRKAADLPVAASLRPARPQAARDDHHHHHHHHHHHDRNKHGSAAPTAGLEPGE
jgi:ABC-type nickel/cobalt efflux system permease component RcnA